MDSSTKLTDAAAVQKAAEQVQAAVTADAVRARGWLRRKWWGVAGVAVILALILVAVLTR